MGNSGSVHHMQSDLKESHSFYQLQANGEGPNELSYLNDNEQKGFHREQKCLEREKSLLRSKFSRLPSSSRNVDPFKSGDISAKNSQVKVLPSLTGNLRLRSTTNGAILQSGGTISGRKDSIIPQPISRAKTFIEENSGKSFNGISPSRLMPRRTQTQLNIDLRKGNTHNTVNSTQPQDNNLQYKRFSSTLDLKTTNGRPESDLNVSVCNSSETYQKLSKVKIKNKKRKAPPVPPSSGKVQEPSTIERKISDLPQKDIEMKPRLFKTKSETIIQASYTRQQSLNPKTNSKSNFLTPLQNVRSSCRSKITLQNNLATTYRREKSFDATLLCSKNKEEANNNTKISTTNKQKSLQRIKSPSLAKKTDFKTERSDFKIELEAATKSRLLTKFSYAQEPSTRQRNPNNDKPKPVKIQTPPKTSKSESKSKIPQLKKTFYFGMENSKQKSVDSSQKLNTCEISNIQEKSPKEDLQSMQLAHSLKDCVPVYSLNEKCSSEINDNGIHVNVRPTLPRRQLEIPRFSPVGAWRTLSEEYLKQSLEPPDTPLFSNFAIEAANTFLVEDRIYRTYREPCPFYPDNKSGDSGISGDEAYLTEKPIQPRNLMHVQNECDELMALANLEDYHMGDQSPPMKVVGPFLTPWTPQQDLEEEDTSSDGDLAVKLVECQSPTTAHVFSLSLPRETQLSIYGEKSKPDFRSLQKLKRSVSGELNGSGCEYTQSSDSNLFGNVCLANYRSDNWVLSKTGVTLSNEHSVACSNTADSNKKSSHLDLSVSIQPISLGCLATGKHVMYLPNRPVNELKRHTTLSPPTDVSTNEPEDIDEVFSQNIRTRNKRFSFQSSVRQIERRRLAEKLSKDVEQKEALRKSELEAMRRVEEEFQRKRAYEKASIRHQLLRLYSMDDDNFASLPVDNSRKCNGFRAEPDGAVSSTSVSPTLRINDISEEETFGMRRNIEYRSNNEIGNDVGIIFANS